MCYKTSNIQTVILCGGSGKRLWPLSTSNIPKQFLNLNTDYSLLQETYRRLQRATIIPLRNQKPPIVLASHAHKDLIIQQLSNINHIILEPISKNTAPALTLAALHASMEDDDPILIISPSDHFINDNEIFYKTIHNAVSLAENNHIVLLGVKPNTPQIEYGYIQVLQNESEIFTIQKFVEKPSIELAKEYLASNNYFWNSGVFILKASMWLKAIKLFHPDIFYHVKNSYDNRTLDSVGQNLRKRYQSL